MYIYAVQRIVIAHDGYVSTIILCAFHTYDEALANIRHMEELDTEEAEDGNRVYEYQYFIHEIWLN